MPRTTSKTVKQNKLESTVSLKYLFLPYVFSCSVSDEFATTITEDL